MRGCNSFVLLAIVTYITEGHGAVGYYGKYIGPLKSFYHGVSGDVYAVDARTLHLRDFTYDGEGPAAYFYIGNSKAISSSGQRLLDERGQPHPLKRYRRKHITITLPEGRTLANVKWFSVYCDEAAVNFGDVKIPKGLDFPKPQKIAPLAGVHAVSSEPVVIVDAQTLLIPSFSYDGEAPDAKFWVGRGSKPSPQGIRVPDENGKEVPLRRYDRKTIVLTLPGDLTVFDIGHFGIWCEAFTVDFGHVQVPAGLNVPPSLKMLGVSPQKRSRSLELSALHPSQQLHQAASNPRPGGTRDKNYDSNFNYQNVLPLFNVQETIRPTTYRPQLLHSPAPVNSQLLHSPNHVNHQLLHSPASVNPQLLHSTLPVNPQLLHSPAPINHQLLRASDHRFSQKQTNGYLPLNNIERQRPQPGFPSQRHFPAPSVQIVPSISLNDDNGLISQNQFDLGPPLNQQLYIDPTYYNQQLQYNQFGNGQHPFHINVQEEQFPYQRPIRKESDRPPIENGIKLPQDSSQQIQIQQNKAVQTLKGKQTPELESHKAPQSEQSHPEAFQIPLLPKGTGVSVSTAVLAEEFEHTSSSDNQQQTRQTLPPPPQEFLTVPPQFINNGFFSTDFVPSASSSAIRDPSRLRSLEPKANTGPSPNIPPFTNNPQGSFSRFVISSGSGVHESLVKY